MTEQSKEQITETEALIKLIEIGRKEFEEGKYQTAEEFFNEMKSDENFSTQKAKENDLINKQG